MPTLVRTRHLPHWDVPGTTYFVTSCLAGSIPARGWLDIANYRRELEQADRPTDVTPEDWQYHRDKLAFGRTDRWLDSEPAVRHLEDPRLAQIVADSMLHFAGERYALLAYVVMPSHFHWVFRPSDEWVAALGLGGERRPPRERIMHGLKRFTAFNCNLLRTRQGAFWQDESFDHCVRDEDELHRIIAYVENNPVKAGLVAEPGAWPFSSAGVRARREIRCGEPLL